MIYDYKILHSNNEEILYLFLDFSSEFAKLDYKKNSFKKLVKDYIKKNKIIFKGFTVLIVIGGTVIGSISMNENRTYQPSNIAFKATKIINLEKEKNSFDKIIENQNLLSSNKTTKKTTTSKTKKSSKNTKKVSTKKTVTKKSSTTQKIKPIYVNIYRSNGKVLKIELEKYLIGVVGAEMPASFHTEALKAQAVISRTYAMNAIKNNKKLTDNSLTQNYKTDAELKKMWGKDYTYYYNRVKKAVNDTKGEYLTYKCEIIEAVYHSTSNGKTEDAKYVWGESKPYLVSVISKYDTQNSSFKKEVFYTYSELSKLLNQDIDINTIFEIENKTTGNRAKDVKILNSSYTGVEIRKILNLRSTDFSFKKTSSGVKITTKGYGHGVGLSQYGANGYAKNGYSYKKIINHYYKGVKISK